VTSPSITAPTSSAPGASILYVDDETSNLVVFAAGLRGVPVVTASSGAAALEVMRSQEIAVLISDQRMPGMSGVDLLAAVRAEFPDTVRILVTAYSDLEAAIDAINRGQVDQYLRKPWEPVQLRQVLLQGLERYRAVRWAHELERRMRETERLYSLGVIATGVAHELRGPLTALTMNLELVTDLIDEPKERPTVVGALQDARLSVQSIAEIITSVELSTRSHTAEDVDFKEVVDFAVRSASGEARHRGQLVVNTSEVPLLRASRTRLGQVVLNLIVNALEAFDVEHRARNLLTVTLGLVGAEALLTVQDNGAGIAKDAVSRIFDPFFTTKLDGGTGLGLAISKQIVEELGGRIDVSSIQGEGTTFRVHLPVSKPA
jgi:signal transduction histidine kinase